MTGKPPAAHGTAIVKSVALNMTVLFLLFAGGEACCQSDRSYADSYQGHSSNSSETPSQNLPTSESLPDAPSADVEHPHRTPGTTDRDAVTPGSQPGLVVFYAVVTPTNCNTFFDKRLYPALLKRNPRYRAATGGSLMRRATGAASHIFITRDDSGKGRLNDSYFSGVLTSVVVQTANTPYWTRSASTTFNNVGSTVGSDVGWNVFHEFEPDIREIIIAHTPKFVSRIEEIW
jgi:hypothetical protein